MQARRAFGSIIFFGIVLLPFPTRVLAQALPEQAEQSNLNDTQLKSFAKAYVQIQQIRQTYLPRLSRTQNPEESKQIQNEAVSKVEQAITEQGIDADTYGTILQLASADDGFRQKVIEFLNEEKQNS